MSLIKMQIDIEIALFISKFISYHFKLRIC
jgi:hypothetical protein